MSFDEESKLLATGSSNGSINIINVNYGEIQTRIDTVDETNSGPADTGLTDVLFPVTWLKWKPKYGGFRGDSNILAASYGNNLIKIWDTTRTSSPKIIKEEENSGVYTLDYNFSGSTMVSGGADATLRIYDSNNFKVIQEYKPGLFNKVHHFNRIHCVKFHPEDENILYSGGADKHIWIHDLRLKDPINSIIGPYIIGDSMDILNNKLLTGSYRSKEWLEVWDLRNYERTEVFEWDKSNPRAGGQIVAARFTKGSTYGIIAAGRAQKDIKIFDRHDGEVIAKISGYEEMNYSMDSSNSGNLISIGNTDGSIYLYDYE